MLGRIRGITLAALFIASAAGAQDVRIADSLLRQGMLERAEIEYYAAARARPRDPIARFALGKYLIDRGAFRIGATLIDEAIQFGYDRTAGSAVLARVYVNLGDYAAIERLPQSSIAADERGRARWLGEHSTRVDSTAGGALAALARVAAPGYLGSIRLRVNGQPIVALISPQSRCGLRLSDTTAVAAMLHRFGAANPSGTIAAAADSVAIGQLVLRGVPVDITRQREPAPAVICLGMLARFAPTFDPRANLMVLHRNGAAPPPSGRSTAAPILDLDGDLSLLIGHTWSGLASRDVSALLDGRRWTFDTRRREVTIEP